VKEGQPITKEKPFAVEEELCCFISYITRLFLITNSYLKNLVTLCLGYVSILFNYFQQHQKIGLYFPT
jgi:hypothetical protein